MSFLWLLLFAEIVQTDCGQCPKSRTFFRVSDQIMSPGTPLKQYTSLSRDLCERTCRQYKECTGYLVQLTHSYSTGVCGILTDVTVSPHVTTYPVEEIYSICPEGMIYRAQFHTCYAAVLDTLVWAAADTRCKEFHQGAHIIDIQDTGEHQNIVAFFGEAGITAGLVWINARRRSASDTVFYWVNTGEDITLSSLWYPGEPEMAGEMCAFVGDFNTLGQWYLFDTPCNYANVQAACEYKL